MLLLAAALDVVAIEHVGSTAVPGLAAKPTIDIAVGKTTLALGASEHRRLRELGYEYGGTHGRAEHAFRKGPSFPRRFLVHVVEYNGAMWRDYLRFRDHLRSHPDDARRYEELKAALLVGRGGWYAGVDKEPFIASILAKPSE